MSLRIGFFSTPEHRVFHYNPSYYDPTKEHIEELRRKYGKDKTDEEIVGLAAKDGENIDLKPKSTYIPGAAIRGSFRKSLEENRKEEGNRKVKRVIVLLGLLAAAAVAYYLAQGLATMLMNS